MVRKIQPVILAGGKGTRMKAEVPKPLFEFQGRSMIRRILDTLEADEGCFLSIIVVGHGGDQIKAALGDRYRYAEQTELTGTATAVKAAMPFLGDEPVLVLYGDNPFISTESIRRMREMFFAEKPKMAMFSTSLPNYEGWREVFLGFGRVKRDADGNVLGIVEAKNASPEELTIREVTPGGNCFDADWLRVALPMVRPHSNNGEYYLTELVTIAVSSGQKVIAVPVPPQEAVGINSLDEARLALEI
jgi:bifunctional UDP-N-acetylglucosamine pyrophosphorylase/glucosamine-1-phosphate N-acetyltransferase